MTDILPLEQYRHRLIAARAAIPRILEVFEQYALHATWATVGMVLYDQRSEALRDAPEQMPEYTDLSLASNGKLSAAVGPDETTDPYNFGRSLARQILAVPYQEIGTHTFSHYYCVEPGQDISAFRADLEAAKRASASLGLEVRSIVFPRHQIAPEYLPVCQALGITAYRGNVPQWAYHARPKGKQTLLLRMIRASDTYANMTGHHTYDASEIPEGSMANVRASHYLRPYNHGLRLFEPTKLARIQSSMKYAARRGQIYHLWMHPEDFGQYTQENIRLLRQTAEYFVQLQERYGMCSLNMEEQASAARLSSGQLSK